MDQEVTQQGSGGYTTRIRRLLAGFFFLSVLLSPSVERCFVSHMRAFLLLYLISISSVFRGAKVTFLLTNCFMLNLKFSYFLIIKH